jgi:hypothetical protein
MVIFIVDSVVLGDSERFCKITSVLPPQQPFRGKAGEAWEPSEISFGNWRRFG